MFRAVLFLLILSPLLASVAVAETSASEVVRYRLENWKRKHIHDTAKAEQLADVFKKLGCEVEKADHNGHIDIKYRCPQWRQITIDSSEEAVRWEKWLKQNLFQTERG